MVTSTKRYAHFEVDDFNIALVCDILADFKKHSNLDLAGDHIAIQRIGDSVTRLRIELSLFMQTKIILAKAELWARSIEATFEGRPGVMGR